MERETKKENLLTEAVTKHEICNLASGSENKILLQWHFSSFTSDYFLKVDKESSRSSAAYQYTEFFYTSPAFYQFVHTTTTPCLYFCKLYSVLMKATSKKTSF